MADKQTVDVKNLGILEDGLKSTIQNTSGQRMYIILESELDQLLIKERLKELYDWKNNSPAGREGYADKRIRNLENQLGEKS